MLSYQKYDDLVLVDLLRSGDKKAFATLFDRYQPLLYVYACKITKDESEASDIVQEVFISLWERREVLDLKAQVLPYLYQAVRFKFFNLLDKKKVRKDYLESMKVFMEEGSLQTDNQVREREMLRLLEMQVAILPEKLKRIYELHLNNHMTKGQIAKQLNLSEKTVGNRLSIATRLLKLKIGLNLLYLLIAGIEVFSMLFGKR